MALDGERVLALETRRGEEMAELIRRQGGVPTVVAAMREVPLEAGQELLEAFDRLWAGEIGLAVFLTGVGVRNLDEALAGPRPGKLAEALRRVRVVARGPKAAAALRKLGVEPHAVAPEPHTWREVLAVLEDPLPARVAVQEYGRPNPDLYEALRSRGAEVIPLRIYRWELPADTGPLRQAVRDLEAGRFDFVVFTTPNQIVNLFRIADDEGGPAGLRAALERAVVASIGPSTTETLAAYGLRADLEPARPRMGYLVRELAERGPELAAAKAARRAGRR